VYHILQQQIDASLSIM